MQLGLPAHDARRKIMARNLRDAIIHERLLDEAAASTDGLSGAQVREVAYLALQSAVLRDAGVNGRLTLTGEDVTQAIAKLRGTSTAVIGFARQKITG